MNSRPALHKLKFLIFLLLWAGIFYSLMFKPAIQANFFQFLKQQPVLAPFILILMQVVFASLMLPCSPLTLFAGILWGLETGLVYSTMGTLTASMVTFLLGRYILNNWLQNKIPSNITMKIRKLVEDYNWKASMIAHINPVFPGSSLGYIFGASNLPIGSFCFGAIMGTLPLQLMMVCIGHLSFTAITHHFNNWLLLPILIIIAIFILHKQFLPKYFKEN